MVRMGFEPGTDRWRAQTSPLSYRVTVGCSHLPMIGTFVGDGLDYSAPISVTRGKSPNVYKSCPKIISLEK